VHDAGEPRRKKWHEPQFAACHGFHDRTGEGLTQPGANDDSRNLHLVSGRETRETHKPHYVKRIQVFRKLMNTAEGRGREFTSEAQVFNPVAKPANTWSGAGGRRAEGHKM
jgi:hypothetical protein